MAFQALSSEDGAKVLRVNREKTEGRVKLLSRLPAGDEALSPHVGGPDDGTVFGIEARHGCATIHHEKDQ